MTDTPETILSEQARAASAEPGVAAALAASERVFQATLDVDVDAFVDGQAPEAMVNNPANMVVPGAGAVNLMRQGLIAYSSMTRNIEYAALLPGGDYVVFMGEEAAVPKGASPHVGKTVRRRFTDLLHRTDAGWKLSVRQATIISID